MSGVVYLISPSARRLPRCGSRITSFGHGHPLPRIGTVNRAVMQNEQSPGVGRGTTARPISVNRALACQVDPAGHTSDPPCCKSGVRALLGAPVFGLNPAVVGVRSPCPIPARSIGSYPSRRPGRCCWVLQRVVEAGLLDRAADGGPAWRGA